MAEGLRSRIIENPEQEPELLKKLIALDHQKQLPPDVSIIYRHLP